MDLRLVPGQSTYRFVGLSIFTVYNGFEAYNAKTINWRGYGPESRNRGTCYPEGGDAGFPQLTIGSRNWHQTDLAAAILKGAG